MGGSDSRCIVPRSYGGLGDAIPALVAEGFGLKALEVKTPTEQDAAMDKAFSSTAPVFLASSPSRKSIICPRSTAGWRRPKKL